MRRQRRYSLLGLVIGCAAVAAASALAQGGSRQSASLSFTETRPGEVTGVHVSIDYANPDDSAAKPPSVRRVVTALAPHARYDTSVPELCTASDAELMVVGASACPPGSVVGEGVITLDTGIPGPGRFVTSDVTFLNNTNELIFLNTDRQSGARVVVRGQVRRRSIVSEAPFLPGAPPDGTAIDTVEITDYPVSAEAGGAERNYITTPPRCPRRGFWRNHVRFTYADGERQVVETRADCDR